MTWSKAGMTKEVKVLFFFMCDRDAALHRYLSRILKLEDAKRLLDTVVHGCVVKWDVLSCGNLDNLLRCNATQKRSCAWKIAMSGPGAAIK